MHWENQANKRKEGQWRGEETEQGNIAPEEQTPFAQDCKERK